VVTVTARELTLEDGDPGTHRTGLSTKNSYIPFLQPLACCRASGFRDISQHGEPLQAAISISGYSGDSGCNSGGARFIHAVTYNNVFALHNGVGTVYVPNPETADAVGKTFD
jgi:hypothetical protein